MFPENSRKKGGSFSISENEIMDLQQAERSFNHKCGRRAQKNFGRNCCEERVAAGHTSGENFHRDLPEISVKILYIDRGLGKIGL